MSERKYNEEKYNKLKVEGDDVKNAAICDQIADDNFMWNPSEAAFWRKKAIEHVEKHYGKESMENTVYYDKIVKDLLEKGSYQQAAKWNNKSKKIKIKAKGEYAFEVLTNELYEMQLNIFLKKYDEIASSVERVKYSLKKNSDGDLSVLYHIYLKLVSIESDHYIYTQEDLGDRVLFADNAIDIAKKIYGEDSIETAEAYRVKAIQIRHIGLGQKDNEEALQLLRKALLIAIKREGNIGNTVKKIFLNIRQCWDNKVCWQESTRWACDCVSREFVSEIMGIFPPFAQQQIKEVLRTIE